MNSCKCTDQNACDLAMALFNNGDYKAASVAFRERLAQNPNDTTALFHLALSLYELRRFRHCLKYWARLKRIKPDELNVRLNIGCAYQNLGRDDLAVRYFKQELKINPFSGETLYSLGTLYYNRKNFKMAANYLERCYWLRHSVEKIAGRLADSFFRTRKVAKEIEIYEDFLKDHPNDTWCLNNLGAALMQLGEYNRAQIFLRRALRIAPKDQRVLRNLNSIQALRNKNCPTSGPVRPTPPDNDARGMGKQVFKI